MDKLRLLALLGALAAMIATASLGGRVSAQDQTATAGAGTDLGSLSGSISADGSSTVGPITEAVAEEFSKEAKSVKVTVDISGTGGGFKRFCNGETDVQDASRAAKAEEEAACAAKDVKYYRFEVAYDGISIVVNPDNDFVDCLKVDDLKRLWEPESKIKTWKDLNPDYPADEIKLYAPATDSGTFDYFTEKINGKEGSSREDYTPSEDDNVLVEGVAGDTNALGYFGFAYYEQNQDKLKLVKVDAGDGCKEPSTDSIRDGSYKPLSRPLYVYVKEESLQRPEVQAFVRFYLAKAKELVADVGYVDSPDDIYISDTAKLEAALGGSGAPDGPNATPTT